MAWLDDRVWCHPKVAGLSDKSFRVHVCSIAYSSGFSTGGVLTTAQQRLVGATARQRSELVTAGLWDELEHGAVRIHDWDEHNGKRDAKRQADRERLRDKRATIYATTERPNTRPSQVDRVTGDRVTDEVNPEAVNEVRGERPEDFKIPELRSVS